MSRGFPVDVATALAQQHVAIVSFAKLEFPSGTVYLHNSLGTYTWGGQDWLGVGDLGSISQVEEGLDVRHPALLDRHRDVLVGVASEERDGQRKAAAG